ncbi:Hypothetical predicted protein [Pelobates cultripes]|uniref:Uncharacterized protein n=1 Tax=Pelobates cultripes TaxID=61616 RepID=A0AAD1W6L3_PELCU|nr:Hypothetical predicted protein [Pelobates cultripes]
MKDGDPRRHERTGRQGAIIHRPQQLPGRNLQGKRRPGSGAEDAARGPSCPPKRVKATNTARPTTYPRRRSTKRDQHGRLTRALAGPGAGRIHQAVTSTTGEVCARAYGSGVPGKPSPWRCEPGGAGLCRPLDGPVVVGGGHRLQACGQRRVRCRNTLLKGPKRGRGGAGSGRPEDFCGGAQQTV